MDKVFLLTVVIVWGRSDQTVCPCCKQVGSEWIQGFGHLNVFSLTAPGGPSGPRTGAVTLRFRPMARSAGGAARGARRSRGHWLESHADRSKVAPAAGLGPGLHDRESQIIVTQPGLGLATRALDHRHLKYIKKRQCQGSNLHSLPTCLQHGHTV